MPRLSPAKRKHARTKRALSQTTRTAQRMIQGLYTELQQAHEAARAAKGLVALLVAEFKDGKDEVCIQQHTLDALMPNMGEYGYGVVQTPNGMVVKLVSLPTPVQAAVSKAREVQMTVLPDDGTCRRPPSRRVLMRKMGAVLINFFDHLQPP